MKQITRDTLDRLLGRELFTNVGQPLPDSVVAVDSWELAAKKTTKRVYRDIKFRAQNLLTSTLCQVASDEYQEWNNLVDEFEAYLNGKIVAQICRLKLSEELTTTVNKTLQRDLINIALETDYSEYVPPGFSSSLLPWYEQGHFPCGWQGTYPAGKLFVY